MAPIVQDTYSRVNENDAKTKKGDQNTQPQSSLAKLLNSPEFLCLEDPEPFYGMFGVHDDENETDWAHIKLPTRTEDQPRAKTKKSLSFSAASGCTSLTQTPPSTPSDGALPSPTCPPVAGVALPGMTAGVGDARRRMSVPCLPRHVRWGDEEGGREKLVSVRLIRPRLAPAHEEPESPVSPLSILRRLTGR